MQCDHEAQLGFLPVNKGGWLHSCIHLRVLSLSSKSVGICTARHSSPGRVFASGASAKRNSWPPACERWPETHPQTLPTCTLNSLAALVIEECQVQVSLLRTGLLQTGFNPALRLKEALAWKCAMFSAGVTYSKLSIALFPLFKSLWLTYILPLVADGLRNVKAIRRWTATSWPKTRVV